LSIAVAAALAAVIPIGMPAHADRIEVDGLNGVWLGTWPGVGDLEGDDVHCVYAGGRGGYAVRATGIGGFTLWYFVLPLPVRVYYSDGGGFVELEAGRTAEGFRGARSGWEFDRCRAGVGRQQRLRVRITEQALSSARAGLYGGLLNLTIVPE
jgi:hypothetical protein